MLGFACCGGPILLLGLFGKATKVMTLDARPGMKDVLHPERLEVLDGYFAWCHKQAKK